MNTNHNHYQDSIIIHASEVNEHDVILGRGARINKQRGNVHFRTLVQQDVVRYYEAKRGDKPVITKRIVYQVQSNGGRFLQVHRITNKHISIDNISNILDGNRSKNNDDSNHINVDSTNNTNANRTHYLVIDDKAAMAKTSQTFRDVIAQTLKSNPKAFQSHSRESVSLYDYTYTTSSDYDKNYNKDYSSGIHKNNTNCSNSNTHLHTNSNSTADILLQEVLEDNVPNDNSRRKVTVTEQENGLFLAEGETSAYNVFTDHDGLLFSSSEVLEKQQQDDVFWSTSTSSPTLKILTDSNDASQDVVSI